MNGAMALVPAILLTAGLVLVEEGGDQRQMPLRMPLADAVPDDIAGFVSTEIDVTEAELSVAAMTEHVLRSFGPEPRPEAARFSVYVAYYDSQAHGTAIHSPRNCLPGAGWEPLTYSIVAVPTPAGPVDINRYLVRNGDQKALVLYWYQGRGRVAASEYAVKWHLLRDAAIQGRTEEALVRVIVPIHESEPASFELGAAAVAALVPAVFRALPEA